MKEITSSGWFHEVYIDKCDFIPCVTNKERVDLHVWEANAGENDTEKSHRSG